MSSAPGRDSAHGPVHHDDPGLQPERTSLSWTRTILSLMICSLTMLRWAYAYPAAIYVLVVVVGLLGGVLLLTQGRRYAEQALGLAQDRVRPNSGAVLLLAASLVLFAGSELVLIVIGG